LTHVKSPLRLDADSGDEKQQKKPVTLTSSIIVTRITRSKTIHVKNIHENGAAKRAQPFIF
jgi:hypothetical protein